MEKDLQIFWKILIGKAALQGVVGGETGMQEMEIKSRGKWRRLGEMGASQDSDASSWLPSPTRHHNKLLFIELALSIIVYIARYVWQLRRMYLMSDWAIPCPGFYIETPHSLPPHDLSRFI